MNQIDGFFLELCNRAVGAPIRLGFYMAYYKAEIAKCAVQVLLGAMQHHDMYLIISPGKLEGKE